MKMKKILLWIWQLPQNLIGLCVVLFMDCIKIEVDGMSDYWTDGKFENEIGVCLGDFIIMTGVITKATYNHERGHQKQSRLLGWLYLPLIGLPSALGNLWDRYTHKNWTQVERYIWYYSQPWEKWADRLGGVWRIFQ